MKSGDPLELNDLLADGDFFEPPASYTLQYASWPADTVLIDTSTTTAITYEVYAFDDLDDVSYYADEAGCDRELDLDYNNASIPQVSTPF